MDLNERRDHCIRIAKEAGGLALDYFRRLDSIAIETKGHQDFVSEADKAVERAIRAALAERFPLDAVLGEEYGHTAGSSGFTWVIDPIDGTANFINGIPAWTVVLACVEARQTVAGAIHDPNAGESFAAARDQGATLNGAPLRIRTGRTLGQGSVGVGCSNRTPPDGIRNLIGGLMAEGSLFYRNASGALSLAYVAGSRLIGYVEEHMNAWDCLAGQLIVREAGGGTEAQDADAMLAHGGRVVTGAPDVFPDLVRIADAAFGRP